MRTRRTTKINTHGSVRHHPQGFTFIEVLAGIIVSTIFVLITAQATFISVVLRVQAQRASEAMNQIQSDFDEIKYLAALPLSATCNATTSSAGYAQALVTEIKENLGQSENGTEEVSDSILLVNKDYTMIRTLRVLNQAPFHNLQIGYRVVDPDSERQIAEYYSEIIPDAFFACRN